MEFLLNLELEYLRRLKQKIIDEQQLFNVLFPRLDLTNADIIKNYKNEQVQSVLNDLKNNSRTTIKFKNMINEILNGKTYKEQKEFLANQYNINI